MEIFPFKRFAPFYVEDSSFQKKTQSNHSSVSQRTQTNKWTSENSKWLHVADAKRGKTCASESGWVGIGFSFTSDWLTKWRELFSSQLLYSVALQNQGRFDAFGARIKTAQSTVIDNRLAIKIILLYIIFCSHFVERISWHLASWLLECYWNLRTESFKTLCGLRRFAPIATAHLSCARYTWRGTCHVVYFKRAHRVETQ